MRKKKEIVKRRSRNSGLTVPAWAAKAISELSARSGVSGQKILESALRDGIQTVSEPLTAWVNYQQSSEELFNEHLKSPQTDHGTQPAIREEIPRVVGDLELDPDPRGEEPDFSGLDALELERGLPREVSEDNEVVQTITGE